MFHRHAYWMVAAIAFMVLSNNIIGQTASPVGSVGKKARIVPVNGSHAYLSSYPSAGLGKLHAAVQRIGGDPKVLHIDVDDLIRTNLIVPKNIHLVHMGGAVINLNSNNLTIKGSFRAGPSQVFIGNGVVEFEKGKVSKILPQWWGANGSMNVQKALDAAVDCGAELFLPAGEYVFEKTVEHLFTGLGFNARSLSISGGGPGNTIIDNQTIGEPAFLFGTVNVNVDTGLFLSIQDLEIKSSTSSGAHGVQCEDIWLGRISNCYIHDLTGNGIYMRSNDLDLGLPKTWCIERTLIFKNNGYGIKFESMYNQSASANIIMDQLDVEMNKLGGVYAAAELTKINNSIFAYNGVNQSSHGGIHITGVNGYAVTENLIQGNGFEANYPYDIYADRFLNLKIDHNDMSRIPFGGGVKPDNFIRINGPFVGINAIISNNHFSSGLPNDPFTAITGGLNLKNVVLSDNSFNIMNTDVRYEFDTATKVTSREYGDTVLTNQTIGFANSNTTKTDTYLQRGDAGILKVTGGVANALQTVKSYNNVVEIDCSKGLSVGHTLTEDITFKSPSVSTTGVILNLIVFQPPGGSFTINFDPIFKLAEPFSASGLHFSTIRFIYTGLYWIQLGGAAIDAPL